MVTNCIVTGCKTGSVSDRKNRNKNNLRQPSLFKVPRCNVLKEKWVKVLSQNLTNGQYVCENHFREVDIIKVDRIVVNGIVNVIPREKWALRDNVIPIVGEQCSQMQVSTSQIKCEYSQMVEQHNIEPLSEVSKVDYLEKDSQFEEYNFMEPIAENSEVADVFIAEANSPSLNIDPLFTLKEINNYFSSVIIQGWCYFATQTKLIFIHINLLTRKEDMRFSINENISVKVSFSQRPEFTKDVVISSIDDIRNLMTNLKTTTLCHGPGILPSGEFFSECTGEVVSGDYKRRMRKPRCIYCRRLRHKIQAGEHIKRKTSTNRKAKQIVQSLNKRGTVVSP